MAKDINNVTLTGRIARTPELRSFANDDSKYFLTFSIAVNTWQKDKEVASFFDVVYFGKSAKAISEFMGKGDYIAVSGKIVIESWETIEGIKKTKPKVNADEVLLLRKKNPREVETPEDDEQEEKVVKPTTAKTIPNIKHKVQDEEILEED